MILRTRRNYWGGFLGCLLITGCGSTSVYKVDRQPEFKASEVHKVLVISTNPSVPVRDGAEAEFVRQFGKRGVEAVAGHSVIPPGTTMDKSHIAPFAREAQYDTVLVTRTIGRSKIDPQIMGIEFDPESTAADKEAAEALQATLASPAYAENYELAAVTAHVYTVSTEKRVWSATTKTLLSSDVKALIHDYVNVILNELYKKP